MRTLPALLFTFCALPFKAVLADGVTTQPAPSAWQPVDAAALDAARGGFTLPSGLAVGLGIERMIAVNGELVTQARFAIADVRALNADQAAMVREAMSATLLVQNGRLSSQATGAGQLPAPAASLPGPLSGPAPGPLPGQMTGQLADQLSGQLTGPLTGQLPGQLAGQLARQLPGPVSAPSSVAMPTALPPPAAAIFIQNSLDNQRIQSQLVIDASVNTLSGFKSLNFSSSVLDALATAARQH